MVELGFRSKFLTLNPTYSCSCDLFNEKSAPLEKGEKKSPEYRQERGPCPSSKGESCHSSVFRIEIETTLQLGWVWAGAPEAGS